MDSKGVFSPLRAPSTIPSIMLHQYLTEQGHSEVPVQQAQMGALN